MVVWLLLLILLVLLAPVLAVVLAPLFVVVLVATVIALAVRGCDVPPAYVEPTAESVVVTTTLTPDESVQQEATPKPTPEWRVWRSAGGKFEVEAQFVSRAGNAVKLATKDGQTLTVAVDRMSEEDQQWLRAPEKLRQAH